MKFTVCFLTRHVSRPGTLPGLSQAGQFFRSNLTDFLRLLGRSENFLKGCLGMSHRHLLNSGLQHGARMQLALTVGVMLFQISQRTRLRLLVHNLAILDELLVLSGLKTRQKAFARHTLAEQRQTLLYEVVEHSLVVPLGVAGPNDAEQAVEAGQIA